ncbi:hypothetical protein D3C87_1880500 [compost metagenome]
MSVFRQETIAGVDRLGTAGLSGCNQGINAQVIICRLDASKIDRNVGFSDMTGITVDGAVYGHSLDTHCLGRTHDATSDFSAIGDQKSVNHGRCSRVIRVTARCNGRCSGSKWVEGR